MNLRRVALVVLVVVPAAAIALDRAADPAVPPTPFAADTGRELAAVVRGDTLSSTWHCPGGPTAEGGDVALSIFNAADGVRRARLTVVPQGGTPVTRPLELAASERQVVDLGEVAPAPLTAASLEVFGDGVYVEQSVTTALGLSSAACAPETSSTWYLADGATSLGNSLTLVLYNPFPADVLVDVGFATRDRVREVPELQSIAVAASSVRTVDVGAYVQREPTVSTVVRARNGRIVAGRLQLRDTAPSRGVAAGPGAALAASNWFFPDGEKADGVTEQYVVYNPNDVDAEVTLSFPPAAGLAAPSVPAEATTVPAPATTTVATGGTTAAPAAGTSPSSTPPTAATSTVPAPTELAPLVSTVVPARRFAVVDTGTAAEVPAGRHDVIVSVDGDDTPVVVERVLTRPREDRNTTTVLRGSPGIATERWYVVDPAVSTNGVLLVMNPTGLATTAQVLSIGPAGPIAVTGLESLAVPPAGVLEQQVPDAVGGRPILVSAEQPVVVEWRARAGGDVPGLVSSLGAPELGLAAE